MVGYVICDYCHQESERDTGHIHEAEKFGWKQFCSSRCLSQSRLRGKELICDNPYCHKFFYRPLKEWSKSIKHFCSSHCFAVVSNRERGLKTQKKCSNDKCNKYVHRYERFCSSFCFQQYRRKKFLPQYRRRVLTTIKKFVKSHQRIPVKQEMYAIYKPARIAFGTWNNAIEAAGFKPNQLKFTHKYIANDKHVCDSLAEKIIDDWLFARKIKHLRNVYYPNQKKFKTDFKVADHWLEFFGLEGQLKRYDQLKAIKLKLIKKSKLKLIEIFPKDLFPNNHLDKALRFLLD